MLFADVAGSTALGERLDPESLRRVMARYFDVVRASLERHGGTVEKFIGDAVMAVFGIPELHEDDALRAVRAADELRSALTSLNDDLERDFGVRIEVRTGINTGEVVTGTQERLATGDTVNIAARLEQAAEAGQTLIGRPTLQLVRDAVEVEPLGDRELRGRAVPVEAFRLSRVVWAATGRTRRLDSPMVGRERELARLQQAFDQVEADCACHLFTVLGPAGVGKSRLAEEFLAGIGQSATVARGRCLPYGDGISFWPVLEVVKDAAGLGDDDSPERVRARLAELMVDDDRAVKVVADLLGGSDIASGEEVPWAVRKLLEALAGRRPLVVVFEDVQWGEPAFLDLVEHVSDWSRDAPILLLCVARPELIDLRSGWGGGKLNATTVLLEPLGDELCDRLIRNLLGAAELPAPARDRITEAAEGNPLFVEEMLAMLIDDGRLQRENGAWRATGDLSEVSVPPTMQAVAAARLDRLGGGERVVIDLASVEGKLFHKGAVLELSDPPVRTDVHTHLLGLIRKELIRPDRPSFADEDGFRFRHLLIRDAAYASLSKQVRAGLHEQFAGWLARRAQERVEYDEILGYHLEQAYRYRAELGPVDDAARHLARRAADRLVAGGRRAHSRGDVHATVSLLGRGADLLQQAVAPHDDVLVTLASALGEIGDFGRAEALLAEAEQSGDEAVSWRARLARVYLGVMTHATLIRDVLSVAERAASALERVGDDRALAEAWNLIGRARMWLGQCADAERAHELALAHARRSGDLRAQAEAVSWWLIAIREGPTPVEVGLRRSAELVGAEPSSTAQLGRLSLEALSAAMQGRFAEARELANQRIAAGEELGSRVSSAAVAMGLSEIELLQGDPSAAEARARPGYETLQGLGETGYLSTYAPLLGEALYRQGRLDEADEFARIAEEDAIVDDAVPQVQWRALRAKVLARRGRTEEAERLGRDAVELASKTDFLNLHGEALRDLAEVLDLAGRPSEAAEAIAAAIRLFGKKGNVAAVVQAEQLARDFAEAQRTRGNPSSR